MVGEETKGDSVVLLIKKFEFFAQKLNIDSFNTVMLIAILFEFEEPSFSK